MNGATDGKNEALSAEVQSVLAERGLTDRGAAIKTGLARNTLDNLKRGGPVSRTTISKWAKALNEPVSKWLILAGFAPVREMVEPPEAPQDARTGILVPQKVQEVIQHALDAEDADTAVDEAILFIRRPEHREILHFSAGASGGDKRPGKLAVIRAFEALAEVDLLPLSDTDILFMKGKG